MLQALIIDCVQLMAARARAADIAISLNIIGEVRLSTLFRTLLGL